MGGAQPRANGLWGIGVKAASAVDAQSGSRAGRHGRFSPRDLIVDVVDEYVARMGERDISVVSDIYYSVPATVFGDGDGTRRILHSVLHNAGKLTRKGQIHVECRFENGFPDPALVFTVRLARFGHAVNGNGGTAGGNYFSVRIPVTRS